MGLVRLYTDRARRVLVLAGQEALRLGHDEIRTEHLLIALVHDAQLAFPESADVRRARHRLPVVEVSPLGLALLAASGVTADRLVAETERTVGCGGATSVATLGAVPSDPELPAMSRRVRQVIAREALEARRLHDNYLSTAHHLLGLLSVTGGAARQILANLSVDKAGILAVAVPQVAGEREQLNHEMHDLAAADPSLQRDVVSLATGTTKESWWTRRKVRNTWPTSDDS
jgi:ATP-dependent Clp protease ATP-binding subunit ClpC